MRLVTVAAAVAMLVSPCVAAGQSYPPNPTGTIPPLHGPLPTGTIPSIGLPTIGLPLPPVGLPPLHIPPIGSSRRDVRRLPFVNGGYLGGSTFFGWPSVVMVVPQEERAYVPQAVESRVEAAPVRNPTGTLELDIKPGTAQVFIDGYYMGTPDDFVSQRGEFSLEAGPHNVRIEASGYEPVTFDVKITPEYPITYRRTLTTVGTPAKTAPVPPQIPKTIYLIPGCYLGDVPPKDAALPASCDLSRTVTYQR